MSQLFKPDPISAATPTPLMQRSAPGHSRRDFLAQTGLGVGGAVLSPSLVAASLLAPAAPSRAPAGPIDIGAKKELFLDDVLIRSMSPDVRRDIHPAKKHPSNPLVFPTEPWEGGDTLLFGSVLQDQGKHRMWYYVPSGAAYAESDDGIVWTKPLFDTVRIDGRKTNMMINNNAAAGEPGHFPYSAELYGVSKDPWEKDPARRYKLGYFTFDRNYRGPRPCPLFPNSRRSLGVAASPDGIHWKLVEAFANDAIHDGPTCWMLDPTRKKFVCYTRATNHIPPEMVNAFTEERQRKWFKDNYKGRAVERLESPDLIHWDITETGKAPIVMAADTRDPFTTDIYSMMVFPYETVYIGLVQVFHYNPEGTKLEMQLAVSRDGVHFDRVGDRTPFIPVGPVGSWDRFNNSIANNPPLVIGDELAFYYSGRTYRHPPYEGKDKGVHRGCTGLATIPRDRFVSLAASYAGGEVVTHPVKLRGRQLHLNATANFGKIEVTALDPAGAVVARSKPIEREGLDIPVEWTGPSGRLWNVPVALRINLQNARLYALWCT